MASRKVKKKKVKLQTSSTVSSAKPRLGRYALALFLFSFLLYINSLNNEFALDDAIVITHNEFTTRGLAGVPGILKYDTFRGFFKEAGKDKLVSGGRYRPASLLFFALMVEAFGTNPFVFHLANSLFYAISVVLIFYLFFLWLSPNDASHGHGRSLSISLGTALLFAAHPLHTEVVANIKGLDEVFALLGSVATAWLLTRAVDKRNWSFAFLAAPVFLFALLSKENAITFLGIMPLALYFFRPSVKWRSLFQYFFPVLLATALFLLVRGSALGWSFGGAVNELLNNPFLKWNGNGYEPYSFLEKMATIGYTLLEYLRLLVFPHPLTHDYYPHHITLHTFSSPLALLGVLSHLFLLGYAIWGALKKQWPAFGVAWYLMSLSIVSNIVFPVGVFMSERFLYMPSVGFAFVLAWALHQYLNRSMRGDKPSRSWWIAIGVLVFLFSVKTISRNPAWKDDYTLFTTDIRVSVNSAKLQNSVGGKMVEKALSIQDEEARERMIRRAIPHFQKAIELHPLFKNAYLQLGNALVYLGEYEKSLPYYEQSLKIDPNYVQAITNRGVALSSLRRYEEALQQYERALRVKPDYADARKRTIATLLDAGRYYGEQGDLSKALNYLHRAEKLAPQNAEVLRLLGVAYGFLEDERAIDYFEKALQYADEENKALLYFDLGSAYYNANQHEKGALYHQKAIELDPKMRERLRN